MHCVVLHVLNSLLGRKKRRSRCVCVCWWDVRVVWVKLLHSPLPESWSENLLSGSTLYSQACVKTCWCLCKVVRLLFFLSCLAPAQQCGGYFPPASAFGWAMTAMSPLAERAHRKKDMDGKLSQTEGYKVCSCGCWHHDSGLCLFSPQCLPF